MINVTPTTDSNTQVTEGDKIRVSWLLNAHVNPAKVTIDVRGHKTYSGSDLVEEEVDVGGDRWWRYRRDFVLPMTFVRIEFHLQDAVNEAKDTAYIIANQSLS